MGSTCQPSTTSTSPDPISPDINGHAPSARPRPTTSSGMHFVLLSATRSHRRARTPHPTVVEASTRSLAQIASLLRRRQPSFAGSLDWRAGRRTWRTACYVIRRTPTLKPMGERSLGAALRATSVRITVDPHQQNTVLWHRCAGFVLCCALWVHPVYGSSGAGAEWEWRRRQRLTGCKCRCNCAKGEARCALVRLAALGALCCMMFARGL